MARAILFKDPVLAPQGAPQVDVVATAKTDLKAGQTLDGLGEYMTYGQCERADITLQDELLPIGLAEGCRLTRDVAQDTVITYADVEVPADRLGHSLRQKQNDTFKL